MRMHPGATSRVYIAGKAVPESDVSRFESALLDMKGKEEAHIGGPLPGASGTFGNFAPTGAKQEYDAYKEAALKARLVFQTLYDVAVPDGALLPGEHGRAA